MDWSAIDDVLYGCANQAGEDNRNVARMVALLAGLPVDVPGGTVNRLCGSGLDTIGIAACAIRAGEADLMIAGGVESITRGALRRRQGRQRLLAQRPHGGHHHRLALRQSPDEGAVRHRLHAQTAENVAQDFGIARADQDALALRSQQRCKAAQDAGFFEGGDRSRHHSPQRKGATRRGARGMTPPARKPPPNSWPASRVWCARMAPSPLAMPPA